MPTGRLALLFPLAFVAADPAVGQIACEEPSSASASAAPSLEGHRLLFQQNGVAFYGRAPSGDPPGPAEVVIRNSNRFPVEVSYSVQVDLNGESGSRSVGLSRHCLAIPSQRYASTSDSVSSPATAIRVRNLTISNLSSAAAAPVATTRGESAVEIVGSQAQRAPAGDPLPTTAVTAARRRTASSSSAQPRAPTSSSAPGSQSRSPEIITLPPARAVRAPSVLPATSDAESLPASEPPQLPIAEPVLTPAVAAQAAAPPSDIPETVLESDPAPRRQARPHGWDSVRPGMTVFDWALEATYAVFYLLSATVLVLAGLGLVLPIAGAAALLVRGGASALMRRFAGDR